MIKKGLFVSVWDDGYIVETSCEIDTETKEVFNIETIEDCEDLDILEEEYIILDGVKHPVSNDMTTEYWYD